MPRLSQPVAPLTEGSGLDHEISQEIAHTKQDDAVKPRLPIFGTEFQWSNEDEWKRHRAENNARPIATQSIISATDKSIVSSPSLSSKTTLSHHSESPDDQLLEYDSTSHGNSDGGMVLYLPCHAQSDLPLIGLAGFAQSGATTPIEDHNEESDKEHEMISSLLEGLSIENPQHDAHAFSINQASLQDMKTRSSADVRQALQSQVRKSDNAHQVLFMMQREARASASPEMSDEDGVWETESDGGSEHGESEGSGDIDVSSPPVYESASPCSFAYSTQNVRRRSYSFDSLHFYARCWDVNSLHESLGLAAHIRPRGLSGGGFVSATTGDEAGAPSSSFSTTRGQKDRAQQPHSRKRASDEDDDAEDLGEDGEGRKRPRNTQDDLSLHIAVRYACPYKKYDTSNTWDCSARRPKCIQNGYMDFTQVLRHVLKYHTYSQRCKICWAQVEKSKMAAHQASKKCEKTDCPYPLLLTDQQEVLIRVTSFEGNDEKKWRTLFSELFPDASRMLRPETPYYDYVPHINQGLLPRGQSDSDRSTAMPLGFPVIPASQSGDITARPSVLAVTNSNDSFGHMQLEALAYANPLPFLNAEPSSAAQQSTTIAAPSHTNPQLPLEETAFGLAPHASFGWEISMPLLELDASLQPTSNAVPGVLAYQDLVALLEGETRQREKLRRQIQQLWQYVEQARAEHEVLHMETICLPAFPSLQAKSARLGNTLKVLMDSVQGANLGDFHSWGGH